MIVLYNASFKIEKNVRQCQAKPARQAKNNDSRSAHLKENIRKSEQIKVGKSDFLESKFNAKLGGAISFLIASVVFEK